MSFCDVTGGARRIFGLSDTEPVDKATFRCPPIDEPILQLILEFLRENLTIETKAFGLNRWLIPEIDWDVGLDRRAFSLHLLQILQEPALFRLETMHALLVHVHLVVHHPVAKVVVQIEERAFGHAVSQLQRDFHGGGLKVTSKNDTGLAFSRHVYSVDVSGLRVHLIQLSSNLLVGHIDGGNEIKQ